DLRNATHWDRGRCELVRLLVGNLHVPRHRLDQPGPALGAHRPWIDRNEADAVLAVLSGKRQRQGLVRRVGCPRADLPVRRLHAVISDQVHDTPAALLHHDGQYVAQAAHVSHELELEALLPIVFRQMFDDAACCLTDNIDHDVDAPERLVNLLNGDTGVLIFAEIGCNGDDLASRLLGDFTRRRVERLLAPRADRNIDAFFRQSQRDPLAYAFPAPSD